MKSLNEKGNLLLVLVEVFLIFVATYFGYIYITKPASYSPIAFELDYFINLGVLLIVYILGSLSVGLYNSKLREGFGSIVRRVFFSIASTFLLVDVVLYNLVPGMRISQNYMTLVLVPLFFMIVVFRYLVQDDHTFGINTKRIIVVGAGERASVIERRMRRKVDQKGFELFGYVVVPGDAVNEQIVKEKRLRINLTNLAHYAVENEIDCIVIACDERRKVLPVDALFDCKIRGIEIIDMLDFLERETGQIAVNMIYPSWVIYSNGFQSENYLRNAVDYIFNAFLASIVLIFTWPLMILTALTIYLEDGRKSGASIFYTQVRVGLDGVPFNIYKFRSMRPDAEKNGVQWASKSDMRTTRIGAFIRKFRIDELPQLYNVYRGEMGFVGPRPERPEFVRDLIKTIPYYNQRHNVKPGLTGWAQLKYPYGASVNDSLEKLKYDLYYIKHRSIMFDLFILLRTVEIVIFGKGR